MTEPPRWTRRPMTTPVYRVDFREIDRTVTGTVAVRVPDRVAMVDASGNYCEGRVTAVDSTWLVVRPDFDSWVDCPTPFVEDEELPTSTLTEVVTRMVDRIAYAMTKQAQRLIAQAERLEGEA